MKLTVITTNVRFAHSAPLSNEVARSVTTLYMHHGTRNEVAERSEVSEANISSIEKFQHIIISNETDF